jgi:hypothetical protein
MKIIKTITFIFTLLISSVSFSSEVIRINDVFLKSQSVMTNKFITYCKSVEKDKIREISLAEKNFKLETLKFNNTVISNSSSLEGYVIKNDDFQTMIISFNKVADQLMVKIKTMDSDKYCSFLVESLNNTNQEKLLHSYSEYMKRSKKQ